jgi:acylaminoacyl-peptidase
VLTAPDGARHAVAWMNAMPWEDPDQYTRHSPVYFAGNFKTPMLVLAGESDLQADELYSALRARRVDNQLVRVAGDGKPSARELEMEAMLAWFDRAAGDRREPR